MRILITGACGGLGRAIRCVGAAEHEFVLMDVIEEVTAQGGICASVTDGSAVDRAAEGCDAIIHTAAMHGTSHGKESNAKYITTNVLGAENLFQAALKFNIRRLVMSSTLEVLCGIDWKAYGTTVYDESLPPRPDWIYPVTKLQVEQLGSFYARSHGLEVAQLRYSSLHDAPIEELGMNLLARHVTTRDAASANLLAATRPGLRDEVFLITADSPLTQKDINDAQSDPWEVLERHWPGCRPVLEQHKIKPQPEHFWPVSRIDKAKLMLDWEPESNFENYLLHLGWHRR
jgi:UDP-glucose 4-epimerase